MPELATLQTLDPVQIGATAIRDKWRSMARSRFTPLDALDYSALITVTATVEPGTVGEVRARVAQTGRVTPSLVVTQATENRLLPALGLGTGMREIILEARRVSGDGAVRVLSSSGAVILSSLAGVDAQPVGGSGLADLGALDATGSGSFTGGPVNTSAPVVTGTPEVGSTLTTTTGTWSVVPAAFEYEWETI